MSYKSSEKVTKRESIKITGKEVNHASAKDQSNFSHRKWWERQVTAQRTDSTFMAS